jgi:hypothetical protein
MIKYLLLLILTLPSWAQLQSLAEYNRQLLAQMAKKEKMTPKEVKTLRIRLGTEVTSADDKSYKEGEVLKLLEYATYSSFLNQNKEQEKIVREGWEKYLKLPNSSSKYFEVEYFDFLKKDPSTLETYLGFLTYALTFAPKDSQKAFFYYAVDARCNTINYIQRFSELDNCVKSLYDVATDKPDLRDLAIATEVGLTSGNYLFRDRYLKLVNDVSSASPDSQTLIRRSYLFYRLLEGQDQGLAKDLDDERRKMGKPLDLYFLKLYLNQGDLKKAANVIKNMSETDLGGLELKTYFDLSAEYYFYKNEYRKSNFYIDKAIELATDRPLDSLEPYLQKLIVQSMMNANPDSKLINEKLQQIDKLITDFKITEPKTIAELKLAQLLTIEPKMRDQAAVESHAAEITKYLPAKHLTVILLNKLRSQIKEAKLKI